MKTLILVRHSKAENRNGLVNDFDRSLTVEGKADTKKMAEFLLDAGIIPDTIIASSASRASETAMIFSNIFNITEKNLKTSRKLYYCSAKTILDQVYSLQESVNCVLVVAHNPGISELTRGLSKGKSFFMENTQVSILEYRIDQWYQVDDFTPSKFRSLTLKDI